MGSVEWLDRIVNVRKEKARLEASISEEMEGAKELIVKRLKEIEDLHKEAGVSYGSYGQPNPSASNHFNLHNIVVHEDYSVEFNWTDDWAYGGHDEGHMSLSREEFVNGDFSALKESLEEKSIKSSIGIDL